MYNRTHRPRCWAGSCCPPSCRGRWTSIARTSLFPFLGSGRPRGRCPQNRVLYTSPPSVMKCLSRGCHSRYHGRHARPRFHSIDPPSGGAAKSRLGIHSDTPDLDYRINDEMSKILVIRILYFTPIWTRCCRPVEGTGIKLAARR